MKKVGRISKDAQVFAPAVLSKQLTDVVVTKKYISGYRADGLKVFLDNADSGDEDFALVCMLNKVRVEGTREQVIMAVSLVRATQIARSYARTYAPDLSPKIMKTLKAMLGGSQMTPKKIAKKARK